MHKTNKHTQVNVEGRRNHICFNSRSLFVIVGILLIPSQHSKLQHTVVAGFSNPLPDTLHLLFSWFVCVRVQCACLVVCTRACPAACTMLVALLVAFASRSTPVQWFRAHTDCACTLYYCGFPGWHACFARKWLEYCRKRACFRQCSVRCPSVRTYISYASVGVEDGRPLSESTEWAAWPEGVSTAEPTPRRQLSPVNCGTDAVVRSRPATPCGSTTPARRTGCSYDAAVSRRALPPWSTWGRTGRLQPCYVIDDASCVTSSTSLA